MELFVHQNFVKWPMRSSRPGSWGRGTEEGQYDSTDSANTAALSPSSLAMLGSCRGCSDLQQEWYYLVCSHLSSCNRERNLSSSLPTMAPSLQVTLLLYQIITASYLPRNLEQLLFEFFNPFLTNPSLILGESQRSALLCCLVLPQQRILWE